MHNVVFGFFYDLMQLKVGFGHIKLFFGNSS
jgi:hypothetical protein